MSEERFWELVDKIKEINLTISDLTEEKEELEIEKNDLSEKLFGHVLPLFGGVRDGQVIAVESFIEAIQKTIGK